jgi:hypothetical protein
MSSIGVLVAAIMGGGGIPPSTLNIASATAASYVRQTKSLTFAAGKVSIRGTYSYIVLDITGTSAYINADDSTFANYIMVSIDGAAFVNCAKVSAGRYALFENLAQATRSIIVRTGVTNAAWLTSKTDVISVTGAPPSCTSATNFAYCYDGVTKSSLYTFANPNGAGFTPTPMPKSIGAASSSLRSPMIEFLSSTTYLDILSCQSYVFVSVDEAAPTVYNLVSATATSDGVARRLKITGLSGSHRYRIWTDAGTSITGNFPILDVGTSDTPTAIAAPKGRLDCFGASQTAGGNYSGVTNAHTAIYAACAMMGRVGSGIGLAGAGIATQEPLIEGDWTANKTIDLANDYAILQATTNDGNTTYNATQITAYNNVIDYLLTKYKGVRIIGTYPTYTSDAAPTGNIYPLATASLQSIVTNYLIANPSADLQFIDSTSWTSPKLIGTDGLHLGGIGNNVGNERLAAYYAANIAPTIT